MISEKDLRYESLHDIYLLVVMRNLMLNTKRIFQDMKNS